MRVTVTSKGQITLPKEVRDRLSIESGDQLECYVDDWDTLSFQPLSNSLESLKGILPPPEREFSIEEMDEAVRKAVAKDVMQWLD